MTESQMILDLVQTNAEHICKINDELGIIIERLAVVETKQNIVLLLLIPLVGKMLFVLLRNYRSNKKN